VTFDHRFLAATICLASIAGTMLLVGGCAEVGRDAYERARVFERGASEAELYKVGGRYLGGWLADAPMFAVAFCIDDSSKIVETLMIDW
jgi:hypothetical protein